MTENLRNWLPRWAREMLAQLSCTIVTRFTIQGRNLDLPQHWQKYQPKFLSPDMPTNLPSLVILLLPITITSKPGTMPFLKSVITVWDNLPSRPYLKHGPLRNLYWVGQAITPITI